MNAKPNKRYFPDVLFSTLIVGTACIPLNYASPTLTKNPPNTSYTLHTPVLAVDVSDNKVHMHTFFFSLSLRFAYAHNVSSAHG